MIKNLNLIVLYLAVPSMSFALSISSEDMSVKEVVLDSLTKKSYQMDEVIVEGSFKLNHRLQNQPVSASVIDVQTIDYQNIISISGLSAMVPNLFVSDYGNRVSTPVFIRGIGSRSNPPAVGLYVDGVPYFDRSAFDFNIQDIARIEVLRGPQGTLYGRNTMGGVINVFSKSPFTFRGGHASVTAGNKHLYKGEFSYYGGVGKSMAYSISANHLHQGGYLKNQYTQRYADKLKSTGARARLGWRFAPGWTAFVSSAYEYLDQSGFPYAPLDSTTKKPQHVNYNRDSKYYRNMSNNGLTVEHTNDHIKFSSQSSFQYFDGAQGVDQDFSVNDRFYVHFLHRQQMYSQEFQLRSVSKRRYNWLIGTFLFDQHLRERSQVDILQSNIQTNTASQNIAKGGAIYHQSELKGLISPKISLTAGVRLDYENIEMNALQERIASSGTTTVISSANAKSTYRQLSPKVALSYSLDQSAGIAYLSASKGFKSGGFNTAVDNESERSFKPEYSWSYEVGVKKEIISQRVSFESTLFWIDWKNQQIARVRLSGQGNKILNAGRSRSKGVELSILAYLSSQLHLSMNYGYTHAKFIRNVNDSTRGVDYSKHFIPLVPRHTLSMTANYQKTFGKNTLHIMAEYTAQGRIFWNEANSYSQSFYGLINTSIAWKRDRWEIRLWTKNLLDQEYTTYQFTNQNIAYGQAGRPFAFGTKMSVNF